MALHTNAKRIDFKDLELENVVGEIVLRDQSINLSKLNIQSNMGNGNLTMVYRAKNGTEATAGLDLDMEDVKVEKLIVLFPSIDTLVLMLRSFEGVLIVRSRLLARWIRPCLSLCRPLTRLAICTETIWFCLMEKHLPKYRRL